MTHKSIFIYWVRLVCIYRNPEFKLEIVSESPEIIKGLNDCFFEFENLCQHVESEIEDCPNIECEFYKPLNRMQNKE